MFLFCFVCLFIYFVLGGVVFFCFVLCVYLFILFWEVLFFVLFCFQNGLELGTRFHFL